VNMDSCSLPPNCPNRTRTIQNNMQYDVRSQSDMRRGNTQYTHMQYKPTSFQAPSYPNLTKSLTPTMSSTNPSPISLSTLLELIKSNARALYGRHLTYDIITTAHKRPNPRSLAPTKFDGQKVHALLIGYDDESFGVKGKLLRGAYTVGTGRSAPTVEYAVRLLYDEMRMDVEGFVGEFVVWVLWGEGRLMDG